MSCVMFMPVSFNKEASEASLVVCLFILFSNYVKYLTDMSIRLHQRLSSTLRIAVVSHFSTMPTCVCCLMRI